MRDGDTEQYLRTGDIDGLAQDCRNSIANALESPYDITSNYMINYIGIDSLLNNSLRSDTFAHLWI